jgi:nucleotide-binding universal stress UspA family protein
LTRAHCVEKLGFVRFLFLHVDICEGKNLIMTIVSWKVLVPYDGSKESDRAFRNAIELAKLIKKGGTNVEVNMLNVVQELLAPHRLFDHDLDIKSKVTGERLTAKQYMKEVYRKNKMDAKNMLNKRKNKEVNDSDIVVKTHVTYGYPSDKILQFAEKYNMNLISIGNASRTGISRIKTLALGTVSRNVSERAQCPVMIVH